MDNEFPIFFFGPAGTRGKGALKELPFIREADMSCVELSFTHGVRMKKETAKKVKILAEENNIDVSVHAPYYVNLCSPEVEKVNKSIERIINTCEISHHMGAKFVVFHAGYYGKEKDMEIHYQKVKKSVKKIMKIIAKNKWNVMLAPETTGKKYQFGTLDELKRLCDDIGCGICIDFAHIYARNNGDYDYDRIMPIIKTIEDKTIHFSGINYNEKQGELNHERIKKKHVQKLMKKLIQYEINNLRIICESPRPFKDALKMKRIYEKMKGKKKKKKKEKGKKRKRKQVKGKDVEEFKRKKKKRKLK